MAEMVAAKLQSLKECPATPKPTLLCQSSGDSAVLVYAAKRTSACDPVFLEGGRLQPWPVACKSAQVSRLAAQACTAGLAGPGHPFQASMVASRAPSGILRVRYCALYMSTAPLELSLVTMEMSGSRVTLV